MPYESLKPSDIFVCKKCGKCCRGYGGTYLADQDIESIADFIHVEPSFFRDKYCSLSGGKPVLAQGSEGYCVFWDRHCTIHPVKPRMCRNWPFIESVLIDTGNWRIMSEFCKGIKTDIPDHIIKKCVKQELARETG